MIENLLLQQVLFYTRERIKSIKSFIVHHQQQQFIIGTTTTNIIITTNESSHSSFGANINSRNRTNSDEEPTLCLIESNEENSSELIENILINTINVMIIIHVLIKI